MSICYDFQKWTMITLAIVGISLTVGLVFLVGNASGQTYAFDPLLTKCVIYHDDHLVILDLSTDEHIDYTVYYVAKGYEIKAVSLVAPNYLMYLQK